MGFRHKYHVDTKPETNMQHCLTETETAEGAVFRLHTNSLEANKGHTEEHGHDTALTGKRAVRLCFLVC